MFNIIKLTFILSIGLTLVRSELIRKNNSKNIQNLAVDITDYSLSQNTLPFNSSSEFPTIIFNELSYESLQKEIHSAERMAVVDEFHTKFDNLHGKYTVTEFGMAGLTARSQSLIYNDMLIHRYDNPEQHRQSFGPHIDHELCLKQLVQLNQRADLLNLEKHNSTDLNLYHLLDTYGRAPPGVAVGSALWLGMYEECLEMKIESTEGQISTRYCLASMKDNDWPRGTVFSDLLTLTAGVCLPQACDSSRYKNKYQLIQRLMEFNFRDLNRNQASLHNLYCLPDEDSPLRLWWNSPETLQAVIVFGLWFGILIYATIKYEYYVKPLLEERCVILTSEATNFGLTTGFDIKSKESEKEKSQAINKTLNYWNKIYKMLAITHNLKSLFDTTKESKLLSETDTTNKADDTQQELQVTKPIVDLRCLDGIKVICTSYIIIGHVLMAMTVVISNGRKLDTRFSPAFLIANMVPAFAADAFFAITGILTCYLLFKQNKSHSFITSPIKWIVFIMYRYLRIMPMYVVVIYYCKYISKFTGSGPVWDYGTSSLAHRRRCEEESWLWTLLFGANFKPLLDHCIPSAWYLANDFQFFMLTPIFLAALHRSPNFGQKLLKFCIAAGYLAGIASVLSTNVPDLRPIAKFMPHGFKSCVAFLSATYTQPQYRIPAYLCGLLFGYRLHIYEQNEQQLRNQERKNSSGGITRSSNDSVWPKWFVNHGMKISIFIVIFGAFLPIIGTLIPYNKFYAGLSTAFFMSTCHIMYAVAVGFYILLATTGHGNKFLTNCLSASFWKPLTRLSMCVVLINIEVVNYIMQMQRQQLYIDFFTHSAFNLLGIVATYVMAIVVCVLFEAPIRAAFNELLSIGFIRLKSKEKSQ